LPICPHQNAPGGWSATARRPIFVPPIRDSRSALYVTTDLQTMTRVWMGDLAMKSAIASGRIELDGARELRQHLERWLGLSGFAGIADARRPTHASRNRDRSDRRHSMHLV